MRGLGGFFRLLLVVVGVIAIILRLRPYARAALEERPELVEEPESLGAELDADVGLTRS